jgi:hypothetical protein
MAFFTAFLNAEIVRLNAPFATQNGLKTQDQRL